MKFSHRYEYIIATFNLWVSDEEEIEKFLNRHGLEGYHIIHIGPSGLPNEVTYHLEKKTRGQFHEDV